MTETNMNEHRRAEPPPLAVRGTHARIAAPLDECSRITEVGPADEYQDKDGNIGGYYRWRHDGPPRSCLKSRVEGLAAGGRSRHDVLDPKEGGEDQLAHSQSLVG